MEFSLRDCDRKRRACFYTKKLKPTGLPLVFRLSKRSTKLWNSLLRALVEKDEYHKFKSTLDDYSLVRRRGCLRYRSLNAVGRETYTGEIHPPPVNEHGTMNTQHKNNTSLRGIKCCHRLACFSSRLGCEFLNGKPISLTCHYKTFWVIRTLGGIAWQYV